MIPFIDGNLFAVALRWLLNGNASAYPETAGPLSTTLTDRGMHLFTWSEDICTVQLVADFAFRHMQLYFNTDVHELAVSQPSREFWTYRGWVHSNQKHQFLFRQIALTRSRPGCCHDNWLWTGAATGPTFSSGPTTNRPC